MNRYCLHMSTVHFWGSINDSQRSPVLWPRIHLRLSQRLLILYFHNTSLFTGLSGIIPCLNFLSIHRQVKKPCLIPVFTVEFGAHRSILFGVRRVSAGLALTTFLFKHSTFRTKFAQVSFEVFFPPPHCYAWITALLVMIFCWLVSLFLVRLKWKQILHVRGYVKPRK